MTTSTTSAVNKRIPEGMELVDANTSIPIIKDLESIGLKKYLLGGPGLTADVMGISATPKTGKFYYVFSKEIDKIVEYFDAFDQWENKDSREIFDALLVSPSCVVGVLNPDTRVPSGFRMERLRTSGHSCLVKGGEANPQLLRPKDFPDTVTWASHILRYKPLKGALAPFAQMTMKGLARMGLALEEQMVRDVFDYRCALQYVEPTILMWTTFRKEFPAERVTQIV